MDYSGINSPRVREYLRKKKLAEQGVTDARDTRDLVSYANMAGQALSGLNTPKQDILYNRIQDLGKTPDTITTQAPEFKPQGMGLANQQVMEAERNLAGIKEPNPDDDPQSDASKLLQGLASKMMPDRDFSQFSASQLRSAMPSISKLAPKELSASDRLDIQLKQERLNQLRNPKQDPREALDIQILLEKLKKLQAPKQPDPKIKDKEQEREVPGYGKARTKEEAIRFRENVGTVNKITDSANRLAELGKDVNLTDRQKIAEINTEIGFLVGALRLPLQGPGAMTDSDRQQLIDLIGNPAKLIGVESIERKKLETLAKRVNANLSRDAESVIIDYKSKSAPQSKTITKRQYSPSRDKTRIIYSDGSEEILDGKQ